MSNHFQTSSRPLYVNLGSAIDQVRKLESVYFKEDGFSAARAADYILAEARAAGARDVHLDKVESWWVIASRDHDWLPEEASGIEAFRSLVVFPEGGPNASRNEILLTAFASQVVTAQKGRVSVLIAPRCRHEPAPVPADLRPLEEAFASNERVVAFVP